MWFDLRKAARPGGSLKMGFEELQGGGKEEKKEEENLEGIAGQFRLRNHSDNRRGVKEGMTTLEVNCKKGEKSGSDPESRQRTGRVSGLVSYRKAETGETGEKKPRRPNLGRDMPAQREDFNRSNNYQEGGGKRRTDVGRVRPSLRFPGLRQGKAKFNELSQRGKKGEKP